MNALLPLFLLLAVDGNPGPIATINNNAEMVFKVMHPRYFMDEVKPLRFTQGDDTDSENVDLYVQEFRWHDREEKKYTTIVKYSFGVMSAQLRAINVSSTSPEKPFSDAKQSLLLMMNFIKVQPGFRHNEWIRECEPNPSKTLLRYLRLLGDDPDSAVYVNDKDFVELIQKNMVLDSTYRYTLQHSVDKMTDERKTQLNYFLLGAKEVYGEAGKATSKTRNGTGDISLEDLVARIRTYDHLTAKEKQSWTKGAANFTQKERNRFRDLQDEIAAKQKAPGK